MHAGEIIGVVIGAVCFTIWAPAMISWLRQGVSIPRYVHLLAAVLTAIGTAWFIGLLVWGVASLPLALLLIGLPPSWTYFGWFWLFGPEHR